MESKKEFWQKSFCNLYAHNLILSIPKGNGILFDISCFLHTEILTTYKYFISCHEVPFG